MQSIPIESVEHWPLQRLIPYARNARTHVDAQVSQIAGSIAEFGFVNPILVGDDNVIIAGHGRLLAALQLGLEKVPVIVLGHLTEVQLPQLKLKQFFVPSAVLRNLVVDNDQRPALHLGQVAEHDHRHLFKTQLKCCQQPTMTGDDHVVVAHQDGIDETELGNRAGDL